jgi:uncharacterized protein YjbJ (UPF0337 family)
MHWDQIKGQLKQVSGKLKEKWGQLTDDDLTLLNGKREVFMGRLEQRAALTRAEAEKQFAAFLAELDAAKNTVEKDLRDSAP